MSSIIKVNTYQDANGNALFSSDGSGNVTLSSADLKSTPAFQAKLSSAQSISDNVTTLVQFNTEEFDTNSYYDTSTYRFTPQIAGKYFVYISIGLHALAVSELQNMYAALSKNGTIIKFSHHNYTNNNIRFGTANITAVVELNGSTDYIEAKVIGADASGNASVSDNEYSTFGAYKLIGA